MTREKDRAVKVLLANTLHGYAKFASQRAKSIEDLPNPSTDQLSEHKTLSTASVIFSTMFLEAKINEFYLSAVDRSPQISKSKKQVGDGKDRLVYRGRRRFAKDN